jgi:ATP-dependent DNA helicase RecG
MFTDGEGESIEVIWFNQPHIKRMLADGQEVVLTGKISANGRKLQFMSPAFEAAGQKPLIHAGRLVPIYPQHEVLTTKWLREKMVLIKEAIPLIPENLPEDTVKDESLPSRPEMIRMLHFPENGAEVQRARSRLAFERMYAIQTEALERRKAWQTGGSERLRTPMDIELIRAFFATLKFTPTSSQKVAIYEILRDMEKPLPMNRLLEGDVGSGKTLVATAIMANVLRHGGQCALMVPTEVLAQQHAKGITQLLINFHASQKDGKALPSVRLLTGSTPAPDARDIKKGLASGTVDIVIGTHALIEESVQFKDLRLVIVDEQHRFGVDQRRKLVEKGSPHFLTMTATPIPRTLALTAYGDHDLSVLLEKPGKRQVIATTVVPPKERRTVEHFIDLEIEKGRQVFVICPLITESKDLDEVKNVEQEAARLREEFSRRRIAVLHGRMPPQEKQEIMQQFREKSFDILVSTSVIEVGIDIPNATVIIIEGAERFGLSQLHQLRGRVGRGDDKSYCFLFTTSAQQASSPRLKAMEEHDSGFLLAEIDLKLRGPGELLGLRQSGLPEGTLSELLDPALIVRARRAAEKALGLIGEDIAKQFVV